MPVSSEPREDRDERAFDERRLSFGPAADLYDSVRPTYPVEAARWMLGEKPCRVADLGAGTGIFTRILAGLGHDVIAIEPDAGMLAKLRGQTPGVEALEGSAEAIPLPDASLDAVTAAQSHHWFANEAAHAEIARVLRPGGVFAPISNRRDESVEWVAELSVLTDAVDGTTSGWPPDDFGRCFEAVERAEFRHVTTLDADGLVLLVQSRSHYLVASPERQRRVVADVRELASRLPERFELPYVTTAQRAKRIE
jgi:SAM-dependent methyltransferase